MDDRERLARMLYSAYGALCHDVSQTFSKEEGDQLRKLRNILHDAYYEYAPNADYDMSDMQRTKMAYESRPYVRPSRLKIVK